MVKMVRFKWILLASLLAFCIPGSCFAQQDSAQLVSPELLGAAKLEIVWDDQLPIKTGETLERLFILGNRIYALSDRNYIVSLNRRNGNPIFSRSLTEPGLPVLGFDAYKDDLFFIIGNKLVEINPEFGTDRRVNNMGVSATCPAARNSSFFYLAGSDGRLHTFGAENKVHIFDVAAETDSIITTIVAEDDFVVFGTEAGNVIKIAPDKPVRFWQFDAAGTILAPIIKGEKSLFFASKDTNVYKIDLLTRELIWKYQTGAVLDKAPHVTADVVYQCVRGKALAAIDRKTGDLLWQVPGGLGLLAQGRGKAYVITKAGTLVVMDNKKAKRLYSVNFADVSRYAVNVSDSKIYIADKAGRIACLKPIE